jgi:hypothetical protein
LTSVKPGVALTTWIARWAVGLGRLRIILLLRLLWSIALGLARARTGIGWIRRGRCWLSLLLPSGPLCRTRALRLAALWLAARGVAAIGLGIALLRWRISLLTRFRWARV